jgi:hypothetical protein
MIGSTRESSNPRKAAAKMRRMPIGIQTFEDIITGGYAYVDKTAWVYRLAGEGKYFFLGRPRRFGKSLLISTLRAYFEGRRELFNGLALEKLENEWLPYPVFHIDLNVEAYRDIEDLKSGLNTNLEQYEKVWGLTEQSATKTLSARFHSLIQTAAERTGRRAVVLIDEYDRPLTQTLERGQTNDDIRDALKGFYGVLKGADRLLRFVLLTGVTKFSKVSVFSDLNMLRDISMDAEYADICGISATELEDSFKPELEALGERNGMTYAEVMAEMKKLYDGYHFCENSEGMFNPFSVLNTFVRQKFSYYWFETGTPTFLLDLVKRDNFDPMRFIEGVTVSARSINDYRADGSDPVPLLYQSGYLTITQYDGGLDEYTLDFPNEEVRYGFLEELLAYYTYKQPDGTFFVNEFIKDLRRGDVNGFMGRLRSLYAIIPYELNDRTERHYQLVFTLVFTLMGQRTRAEVHIATGRPDAIVWTADTVYVFEFKLNGTAEDALRQIDEKGYALPYEAGDRKVVKIGAQFDRATRNIERWTVN